MPRLACGTRPAGWRRCDAAWQRSIHRICRIPGRFVAGRVPVPIARSLALSAETVKKLLIILAAVIILAWGVSLFRTLVPMLG